MKKTSLKRNTVWMRLATPMGELFLQSDGGALLRAQFEPAPGPFGEDGVLNQAAREVAEYFSGARREFTVSLAPEGTDFQRAVWRAMAEIPYGKVLPYGLLAHAAGYPGAARAVGNACNKNPIVLFIPCHRVVAQNGIGGYGGGLEKKRILLSLEGRDDL